MTMPSRDENGKFPTYAWPGGYPIFYLFADNSVCCPACANRENGSEATLDADDKQWHLVAVDVNYEDDDMTCEHCQVKIDCAYPAN